MKVTVSRGQWQGLYQAPLPDTPSAIGVYGKSGAGKTSLLRALAGLETHAAVTGVPAYTRPTMVFQEPCLFPHLTVRENIQLGLKGARNGGIDYNDLVEPFGLRYVIDAPLRGLSGGERQKVALVRALCNNPDLLLLDEPLSGVDAISRLYLLSRLCAIRASLDTTLFLVSHQLDDLVYYCDYLLHIDEGKITVAAPMQEALIALNREGVAGVNRIAHVEQEPTLLTTHQLSLSLTLPLPAKHVVTLEGKYLTHTRLPGGLWRCEVEVDSQVLFVDHPGWLLSENLQVGQTVWLQYVPLRG